MKKILIILTLLVICSTVTLAQKKLFFYADYALFRNLDAKSTVELYFSVNQRDIKFVKTKDNFVGQANIEIAIYDKNKAKWVFDNSFGLQTKAEDTNRLKLNNKLIGQQNFSLNDGDYIFKLTCYDNNSQAKSDSIQFNIPITARDSLKAEMSDIQVASSIEKSTNDKSIFYKNGLEITPNPDALFGMNLKKIFYYIEIYELKKSFSGNDVTLTATISDISEKTVSQINRNENYHSDAFVEIGNISVDSLDKGDYTLKIRLTENNTGQFIEKSKKFFIYNVSKNVVTNQFDDRNFLKSEYANMSAEMVNDEFDKTVYIRNAPESDEFNKMKTLDEKRKFLYIFWGRRNMTPNSPVNDYKIQYFKRVNEANSLFKQGFLDGWKTDRGRIYITYGEPEEVERHPSESDSKGYEIWTYQSVKGQGSAVCAFAERELSTGVYYLVHSTIRGEYRDDKWQDKLKK